MVLVDEGNGKNVQFGHTNYYTGEGRGVTPSENQKERYVNPELTVVERARKSVRDSMRRNEYVVYLFGENNTQIVEHIVYNPFTEDLSLRWQVQGSNGKRLLGITEA